MAKKLKRYAVGDIVKAKYPLGFNTKKFVIKKVKICEVLPPTTRCKEIHYTVLPEGHSHKWFMNEKSIVTEED